MRKILLLTIFVSLFIVGCSNVNKDKKYFYVEISGNNVFNTTTKVDTVEFVEKNDSLAYLKAYLKACSSQKATNIVLSKMGDEIDNYEELASILHFKLFNEEMKEVMHDVVPDSALLEIEKRVNPMEVGNY